MNAIRTFLSPILSAIAIAFAAVSLPAYADALQDANRLLKQGEPARALEQVEHYLASRPKDAQGRFLRGVILAEMNHPNEAILVFTALTEEYPELPEPYNNLAVIYAQQGQYDKARMSLEMAIRANPSYATAYENLGDIHIRLAYQAYEKSLKIDSSNAVAKNKLSLTRELAALNAKTGIASRPMAEARKAKTDAALSSVTKSAPAKNK